MKINIIHNRQDLESLHDAWNTLLRDSHNDVVHLTHEWIGAWWESFGKPNELHIVTAADGSGNVIAIAPMMLRDGSYRGSRIKKICFLANGHSPSADFIVRKDKLEEGVRVIRRYLETFAGWDLIDLQKMDMRGKTFSILSENLRTADHLFGVKNNIESPFITVDCDWETFLHRRSAKFRKVMRNKINRANKAGDISFERVQIADGKDPALEEMFGISQKSWKRHAGTDIMSNPRSRNFYREICERLGPQGLVTLWMLKKGDKRIAFEFHLMYQNVVYPIRADYDESYRELSAGSVLEYNILKTLFNGSNVREYNSCGHTYDYLMNWTDSTRVHGNVEIFSRSFRARSLYAFEYKLLPLLRKLKLHKVKNYMQRRTTR